MATEKLTFEMNAVGNAVPEMKKAQAQVQRLGKTIQTTGGQVAASGKGVQRYGMIAQQAGFQVGDMAVQIAGGTSAIQAFGQQGSQLLGVFGPVGAVLGAGVAIFAAVGTAIMKSSGSVKEMSEELDEASNAMKSLNESVEMSFSPLSTIDDKFGSFASRVRDLSEAQRQLNFARTASELIDVIDSLQQFVEPGLLERFRRWELGTLDLGTAMRKLQRDFSITYQESMLLAKGFSAIARAEGVEGQADAIADLQSKLTQVVPSTHKGEKALAELGETLSSGALLAYEYLASLEAVEKGLDDTASASEKLGKTTLSLVEAQFMLKKGILPPQAAADFRVVNEEVERVYENLRRVSREPEKASSSLKKTKKAVTELSPEMKRLMEVSDMVGSSFETAFMSAIKGTASVKDAFRAMAVDIIAELYRIFVIKQITGFISDAISLFGGAAPGSSGSIFGGMKAIGGPVQAGNSYIVGERGPELFVPSRTGSIVSNDKMGGGGGVVVQQTINVSTGVQQTVRNEIQTLLPQIAEASKAAVLDARRRGGSFANAF